MNWRTVNNRRRRQFRRFLPWRWRVFADRIADVVIDSSVLWPDELAGWPVQSMSRDELASWSRDIEELGLGVIKDGKRVDPSSFYLFDPKEITNA